MMKNKRYLPLVAFALIAGLSQTAGAEYRTWTDTDGTKLEAELIENLHGQVSLRTKDKKVVNVSISTLCAADQKFVLASSPPEIGIDVVEITDTKNEGFGGGYGGGFQIQYGTVQFKVTLTKESTIPYTGGQLTAELYIIGSQKLKGRYGLLGKTVETFSFDDLASGKYEFRSSNINMQQFEAGGTVGAEYEGYYVVLLDEEGRVFKTKGSRAMFEEHSKTIRNLTQGDVIEQDDLLPLRRGSDGPDRRPAHKRK
jgi:hypothetical protein